MNPLLIGLYLAVSFGAALSDKQDPIERIISFCLWPLAFGNLIITLSHMRHEILSRKARP